ncbi:hypothetical protein CI610_03715 [invertebrate metagenome]|uniref:Uncharacterized protein n=1 Tax=invertebrate metagenome TaxID=1711999 RepID=A0A2H9T2C4_9ZZZZ
MVRLNVLVITVPTVSSTVVALWSDTSSPMSITSEKLEVHVSESKMGSSKVELVRPMRVGLSITLVR